MLRRDRLPRQRLQRQVPIGLRVQHNGLPTQVRVCEPFLVRLLDECLYGRSAVAANVGRQLHVPRYRLAGDHVHTQVDAIMLALDDYLTVAAAVPSDGAEDVLPPGAEVVIRADANDDAQPAVQSTR